LPHAEPWGRLTEALPQLPTTKDKTRECYETENQTVDCVVDIRANYRRVSKAIGHPQAAYSENTVRIATAGFHIF
jgi:hypothetical protein